MAHSHTHVILINDAIQQLMYMCTTDRLTTKDLRNVRILLWGARSKWLNIGIELDIHIDHLYGIQEKYPNDVAMCFTEMLGMWLNRNHPLPSWSSVVAALKAPTVQFPYLAAKVQSSVSTSHKGMEGIY